MSKRDRTPDADTDDNEIMATIEPLEGEADAPKGVMSAWLRARQPAPVPGVTESPSNHPGPRTPGQLASGHPVTDSPPGGDPFDPGRVDVHLWQQVTAPARFAALATVSGADGALASSIGQHQGRVVLGMMDQRSAANPSLTSQLAAPPSGNPRRPVSHGAPSGHGEAPGVTPARDPGPAYRTTAMGGQRQPGHAMGPTTAERRAPGE